MVELLRYVNPRARSVSPSRRGGRSVREDERHMTLDTSSNMTAGREWKQSALL